MEDNILNQLTMNVKMSNHRKLYSTPRFILGLMLAFLVFLSLYSCRKNFSDAIIDKNAILPQTDRDIETVKVIEEVGEALQLVYGDVNALKEVNATIFGGYYKDERVLLKDLLSYGTSSVYQTEAFLKQGIPGGTFARNFKEVVEEGNFPLIKKYFGRLLGDPGTAGKNNAIPPDSTSLNPREIWIVNGINVYFPYSENFSSSLVPTTTGEGYTWTTVSANVEADSATGTKLNYPRCDPRRCYPTGKSYYTVNDDYAELNPTHIVGVGAEPARPNGTTGTQSVYVVFIGEVRCSKQYDKLISFSSNGGGPELRFVRGSAFLANNDAGQITSPQNVISVDLSRKDVRKKKWKNVSSIWDADWAVANLNQVFAIYEEDTQATKTYSGSVSTTLTFPGPPPVTGTGTLGYSFTVYTKDDIIRQLNWNRQSFYQYNQGGLQNGCGLRYSWTVYDCNQNVSYTMPTQ